MIDIPIVFFCGSFYDCEDLDNLVKNSKVSLSWANNTLQWGFIKGMVSCYSQIEFTSLPQIGAYPFRYKQVFYKGNPKKYGENQINFLSFTNISLLKNVSQYLHFRHFFLKRLQNVTAYENIIIFVYDLNIPILQVVAELKKKYRNLKLGLIIPDLPSYTGEKGVLHQKYIEFQENKLNRLYKFVNFYVLISEYMKEKIPVPDNKYIKIEGIYNPKYTDNIVLEKRENKCVFYSGAVSFRNGIMNLLDAFIGIPNKNYQLYICGVGDAAGTVMKYAERDKRIIYKGQVLQKDVLVLQKEATLLINPRTSELTFSRYSFPSKIIEYFASGTPTLMYEIDGVPTEYYRYCYSLKDTSISTLREALVDICEKSSEELFLKGESAKLFVEKEKNPQIQCEKIARFVDKLFL